MATSKAKVSALKSLIGFMVVAYFKQSAIVEEGPEGITAGKGLAGFVVHVDNAFIYFGASPDVWDTMLDIDDLGIIRMMDDVDQLLKLTGNPVSSETDTGDMQ